MEQNIPFINMIDLLKTERLTQVLWSFKFIACNRKID